jgi:hypothetical protein
MQIVKNIQGDGLEALAVSTALLDHFGSCWKQGLEDASLPLDRAKGCLVMRIVSNTGTERVVDEFASRLACVGPHSQ